MKRPSRSDRAISRPTLHRSERDFSLENFPEVYEDVNRFGCLETN